MIWQTAIVAIALTFVSPAAFAEDGAARHATTSGAPAVTTPDNSVTSGEGSTTGTGRGGGTDTTTPSAGDASSSGAPTAAGVNSEGRATEPGAVKGGANGR